MMLRYQASNRDINVYVLSDAKGGTYTDGKS